MSNHIELLKKITALTQAQNTIAVQHILFLAGPRRLLFINMGQSAFPNTNSCQNRLRISQPVSVRNTEKVIFRLQYDK
jgi:hypothetical protein